MSDTITLETGEELDVSAYPLPDGIDDAVFNRELLAKAMNVSTVTISKWTDQGMPVAQRGGNGQAYEYRFSECYAWRSWREVRDAEQRRTKEGLANQMAMLFLGEDIDPAQNALSPKAVREWSEAELIRNKAAEQRGELVRVQAVQGVLDHILASYRNAVMNLPDWLEQEFSLSPQQVEKSQKFCDGILDETRRQISDAGFRAGAIVQMDRRQDG